jgi:hypothetical protein
MSFFLKTGQLRCDLNFLVGFAEIHARHHLARRKTRKVSRETLEQAVDFLLQRKEGIGYATRHTAVAFLRESGISMSLLIS